MSWPLSSILPSSEVSCASSQEQRWASETWTALQVFASLRWQMWTSVVRPLCKGFRYCLTRWFSEPQIKHARLRIIEAYVLEFMAIEIALEKVILWTESLIVRFVSIPSLWLPCSLFWVGDRSRDRSTNGGNLGLQWQFDWVGPALICCRRLNGAIILFYARPLGATPVPVSTWPV